MVEDSSRGGGSLASTMQVGELTGQVRGGLSRKSEGGCVRAGVLTGDGEMVARRRSARPTVAGMAPSRAELPMRLVDMAEASAAALSSGGL
jgi:hypothetical protein